MFRRMFGKKKHLTARGAELGREFSVGDVVEQRYEIEKTRRGYMGIVYVAYDRQRRRQVVLKTFQNKFLWDEEAINRFKTEAELWMRIGSHPNIVRAYDLRTFMGKPHVVAEYVHGGPLRTLIGHLELQEALDYAIQICRGMTHAVDQANILHRDLKPDNIMVTLDGQAKVTDFGLARVLPNMLQWAARDRARQRPVLRLRSTIAKDLIGGTLPYMAPELLEETGFVGTWTDIYAFGVMLYEFFTGRLPFDSMRDESLIRMHRTAPVPDPRYIKGKLPTDASVIVLRCLAKRPTDRYQSFAELEDDLQALRAAHAGGYYNKIWPEHNTAERDRWTEIGRTHMDLGEYSEALASFRRAVAVDADQADSWANLARARLKLWQYNEAMRDVNEGLRRAVRRDEFSQLYGLCGEIHSAMQMPPKAMEAYNQGLSYTPKSPYLWRAKGQLIQKMGMSREAQECFEKAIQYDKHDSQAWQLLGDCLRAQERYKRAQETYAEALKLDPRSAESWARYGLCQLEQGYAKEALLSFDAALKLNPDLEEALAGARTARQKLK
ncbi:MAG: protein kinase [Chloroflexi bacterium SZAS-1]|nr:protein kinase [Chloroflexi bacterium SZAS-1]